MATATVVPTPSLEAAPSQLAFAGPLTATSDSFVLTPGRHELPLLINDVAPDGVEVSVNGESLTAATVIVDQDAVTIDIPDDQVNDLNFTYTISSGDATASANVAVSIIHSGAKPIVEDAEIAKPFGGLGPERDNSADSDSLGSFEVDLGVPPALVAVTDISWPWTQFLATLLGCALAAVVIRRRNRRSGFVAVDNVGRNETSHTAGDDGDFYLRHNTEGVWATGRQRDERIEIQTPNGRAWVTEERVSRHDSE